MTKNEILALAEKYLLERKSNYVRPGELGERLGDSIEVIFLRPEALDPDVVIDPPDIRVSVNTKTKKVTWIYQM